MDDLFRPETDWNGLPDVAVTAHRISSLVANVVLWAIIGGAVWLFTNPLALPTGIVAVVGVAWTLWRVVRAGRWIRSFRYSEREHDLLISHGLWFKNLTAIPYGRMLSVEVTTGPISRLWGLAEVQLITASHESNGTIPALTAADAAILRDRLIAVGEAQALPL
ncbi:MAG: PH domain-containing protein [Propionibacteriaceae bacterium]|jgi:membrane protein YdbS with pleckstrin-like domain|nr:PH domain-containing protein [Propionibacteriaceae bacterium]